MLSHAIIANNWLLTWFVSFGAVLVICTNVTAHSSSEGQNDTKNVEQSFDYSWVHHEEPPSGLLYPRESESREVRSLDGVWRFLRSNVSDPMEGVRNAWYADDLDKVDPRRPTEPMPVPASYNDIGVDSALRDHVGTVWYERKFFVPRSWSLDQRVWLRFSSVHYAAIVWLNGQNVATHTIGHLPFHAEITNAVKFGAENRLTVLCDNTLLNTTVPQGIVAMEDTDNGKSVEQSYTFDFFNYAGIHRSVHLYTTPNIYIDDIIVNTDLAASHTGTVRYAISVSGNNNNTIIYDPPLDPLYVHVQLRNKAGEIVAQDLKHGLLNGTLLVRDVMPWWPYLMHPEPGYLYTLEVYLHAVDKSLLDVYRLKVGIRTLKWNSNQLLLNDAPLYLRGFGRHEDSDIRGKGFDYALLSRDFNLLKWIGANAYRTSHYPYSEESMQFADEHGIMIIDESPGVNIDGFEPQLLIQHIAAVQQLIHRDRNHPCVILWSIANEARSRKPQAAKYFEILTNYTKSLDSTRPITASINTDAKTDKLAQYLDIISFNRYNSWYQNTGQLDMIIHKVINEATEWHKTYNKPVIMSEYGADTYEGLHYLPSYVWSEDYQRALFSRHFMAFDTLRAEKWFIGEFVWNFADFKTAQTYTRVGGNKKGVFTRNRQPKAAAYLLRKRYFSLAVELDQCIAPRDLFDYVIRWEDELSFHNDLL